MKNTIITLGIALLISMSSFAQQGINYKAIVKDDAGNVISEQLIVVRFSIYQGDTTNVANIIYQEQFTPTTSINGLITENIEESTNVLSGNFSTIDWITNNHSYFTKCFKDVYNCTPTEFAKQTYFFTSVLKPNNT